MRKFVFFSYLLIISMYVWAGGASDSDSAKDVQDGETSVVNVYSARHYDIDAKLYDDFTRETGITVNIIDGKANELIFRLSQEGQSADMDLLFLPEITRVSKAKNEGLLADITDITQEGELANRMDDLYRDSHWVAVTMRARAVAYDKQASLPNIQSYEDLGKSSAPSLLTRSATHPYNNAIIAYMVDMLGEIEAQTWVQGVAGNLARDPQGNDRDQMRAIIAGVGEIALVNTYYVHLLLESDDEADKKVGERIGIILPNDTHVNVSAVAIGKYAKNRKGAEKLIRFLLNKESQKQLSEANGEYPAVNDVQPTELLRSWGEVSTSPRLRDLNIYQEYSETAAKIADAEGWK